MTTVADARRPLPATLPVWVLLAVVLLGTAVDFVALRRRVRVGLLTDCLSVTDGRGRVREIAWGDVIGWMSIPGRGGGSLAVFGPDFDVVLWDRLTGIESVQQALRTIVPAVDPLRLSS